MRRAGLVTEIPVADVVVGDVVLLGAGESVPADGYIAAGTVRLDQSAMTGESREVEKRPAARTAGGGIAPAPDPASPSSALRGCLVLSGEAEMIVTAVGDATYLGGISGEVQEETRESPLKVRLSHLAAQISRLGYAAAAIVAAAYLFNAFVLDSGFIGSVILMKLADTHYLFQKLIGALTLGLTVVVVAVPEGLPMMIAVVLSANIRRMVKAGVLVRQAGGDRSGGQHEHPLYRQDRHAYRGARVGGKDRDRRRRHGRGRCVLSRRRAVAQIPRVGSAEYRLGSRAPTVKGTEFPSAGTQPTVRSSAR